MPLPTARIRKELSVPLRFADRYHPAFIRRIFGPIAAAGLTQKHADDQSRAGETDRDGDL